MRSVPDACLPLGSSTAKKRCTKCRSLGPFSRDSSQSDGLQRHCKVCRNAAHKIWREANPEKRRADHKRYREENADKVRKYNAAYAVSHPEETRRYRNKSYRKNRYPKNLLQKYGITLADFMQAVANQNGKCPICSAQLVLEGKGARRAVPDHNHETRIFRGVICSHCNKALGLLKDSAETLLRAAAYLDGKLPILRSCHPLTMP